MAVRSEKEGEGWWASMLGFILEDSMGLFIFGIFGAGGAIGATLLHTWVIK